MKRNCFFLTFSLALLVLANLSFAQDQRYALVIGITGYPHFPQSKRLKFADDDAKLFYDFIMTKEGGSFPSVNIRRLYNHEAKRENIIKEINWLRKRVEFEDLVYIFFAGHGWVDNNTGLAYFMPYDADPNYPEDKGFRTDRFVEMLRIQINSKYLILFTDACHSGSVYSSGSARGGINNITWAFNKAWKEAFKGVDAICMAFLASSSNQRSYEDPNLGGGHGLFSWYLVEGMQGASDGAVTGKKDGVVRAGELYRYVLDKVEYHARYKLNKEQSPGKSPEFTSYFPFGRYGISGKDLVNRAKEARKHFNRGCDFGDKGDKDGAIREYKEAIRIDPNYALAHYNLGISLKNKGDIDGAIREYKEAIRLDPNYASAHYNLGNMLDDKGDIDGAIREYKEAIRLDPDHANAKTRLGYALEEREKVVGTVDKFRSKTEGVKSGITHLRSEGRTISISDAKSMVLAYNLAHKSWNPKGTGIKHEYSRTKVGGNEIVIDKSTGLIWQATPSEKRLRYADAVDYVRQLNATKFAGRSRWRLPTLEEAMTLVSAENYKEKDSLLDYYLYPIFDGWTRFQIWTSDHKDQEWTWVVRFELGKSDTFKRNGPYYAHVLAVTSTLIRQSDLSQKHPRSIGSLRFFSAPWPVS